MPTGSCLCGKVKIAFEIERANSGLCHCSDCHKISGSAFSTSVMVSDKTFKLVEGTPKEYTKIADSGNPITSHFCGDCGSTLWRDGPSFPGEKVIKIGVVDDIEVLHSVTPAVELFPHERASWQPKMEGTVQMPDMMAETIKKARESVTSRV